MIEIKFQGGWVPVTAERAAMAIKHRDVLDVFPEGMTTIYLLLMAGF